MTPTIFLPTLKDPTSDAVIEALREMVRTAQVNNIYYFYIVQIPSLFSQNVLVISMRYCPNFNKNASKCRK